METIIDESIREPSASSCAAPVVVENKVIQLPQLYQTYITSSLHHQSTNTMMICHGAILKVIKQLQELMYWSEKSLDVRDYVQHCRVCQMYKLETLDTGKLRHTLVSRPAEVLGEDLIGTLYLQCRSKPVFNSLCRLLYRLERTVLSLSVSRNHSSYPNQKNTLLLGYTSLHHLRLGPTLHILGV